MTIEDRTLGDVFISRCEDKNTLQNKGDLYVGTGATIEGLSGNAYDTQILNAPTENGQVLTKDDSENGKGVKYQNIIEAIKEADKRGALSEYYSHTYCIYKENKPKKEITERQEGDKKITETREIPGSAMLLEVITVDENGANIR